MSYTRKKQASNYDDTYQVIPGQMSIEDYDQHDDVDIGSTDSPASVDIGDDNLLDDPVYPDTDTAEQSYSEDYTSSDEAGIGYSNNPNTIDDEDNNLIDNADYPDTDVSEQTNSSSCSDYPFFANDSPSMEYQEQIIEDVSPTPHKQISHNNTVDKQEKGKKSKNKNKPADVSSCPTDGPGIIYIDHGKRDGTVEKKMTFSMDTLDKIDNLLGNSLSNVVKSKVLDAVLNKALDEMLSYQSKGEFGVFYRPVERERLI